MIAAFNFRTFLSRSGAMTSEIRVCCNFDTKFCVDFRDIDVDTESLCRLKAQIFGYFNILE